MQTVLTTAKQHGESNVLCILDQNMDRYHAEGTFLGTGMIGELRARGFHGMIFICSANDSVKDCTLYKDSGATGSLLKSSAVGLLAMEVAQRSHSWLRMRMKRPDNTAELIK